MVDGSMTRNPLVADYSEWKARDYFQTYYSEVVLPDEQAVLAYQIDVLRAARARFGRGLEYGCGPTMHRAIAASKYAFRIDMADWLADNLAEAREWLCADDSAPEWKRFTRYVLACEGHARPNNERVVQREAQTRKVVRGLYVSDARLRQPLGPTREGFYDLIITGFCIDAISSDPRGLAPLHAQRDLDAPARRHVHHPRAASVQGVQVRRPHVPGLEPEHRRHARRDAGERLLDTRASTRRSSPAATIAMYGYSGILTASGRKAPAKPRNALTQTRWISQTTPAMPSAQEPSGNTRAAYQRVARIE